MAISEQLLRQGFHGKEEDPGYTENEGSETSRRVSDYSESDPIFGITEETHSRLSQLSIEKKPKSRLPKEMDLSSDSDLDGGEVNVPQLDKKDKKTFEKVQEIIQADQLDKLKVDQCKVYLRKHGLRLTGKKEILIQRIKEHRDVFNGGGERKYPASSFVLNCKGDACTGDVVMFEQNVYDMYNIASRSATGPPCCTRMVAGRIVKESYGAAKQQHTFTIEVLWSKGEKPLPPLHPLLIKGRNLYRLNTMRQKWDDEGKRVKTLLEKHSRGFLARANREARVQEKKTRKILKTTRASRNAEAGSNPVKSGFPEKPAIRPQIPQNQLQKTQNEPYHQIQREHPVPNVCKENIGITHDSILGVHPQGNPKLQPMTNMNHYPQMIPSRGQGYPKLQPITNTTHYPLLMNPFHGNYQKQNQNDMRPNVNSNPGVGYQSSKRFCGQEPMATENHHPLISSSRGQQRYPQVCRYYPKGRCHYGDNCKFLHELSVVHAQRKEPRFGQHP